MKGILEVFAENSILFLFILVGAGMLLGKLKFKGISLGAAAVLFVAMAFSALANSYGVEITIDHKIGVFGLVLFTFAIGMNCGPTFFRILKNSIFPILILVFLFALTALIAYLLGKNVFNMSNALLGGTFAGALTNTPTLSAVANASGDLNEATVGYALAYIFGVVGMLIFTLLALGYADKDTDLPEPLVSKTVRVDYDMKLTVLEIVEKFDYQVKIPRFSHDGHIFYPADEELLHKGDLVTVVGTKKNVEQLVEFLGHASSHALDADRCQMDMRRITISNPKFSGRRIKDLGIEEKFNGTISRIRRGDVEMLANPNMRLQQGDRVRVIVPWDRLKELNNYFGDSVQGFVDINPVALGFGMALGIFIGEIPLLAPSGEYFSIGSAAGTLLIGLVFGFLGKIGSLPLTIPYTACSVLSELGLIIFLAQAGSNAGKQLSNAFISGAWISIILLGAVITTFMGGSIYVFMRYFFKMGGTRLSGVLGGAQTQPAVLAFASNVTMGDPRVALGYAMVYPVSMIIKIFLGQILGAI